MRSTKYGRETERHGKERSISPSRWRPKSKSWNCKEKKERLASSKPLWMDGKYNLILAHENGQPYHPRSVQRWWERFIERHNLKYINIHALRHTSATILINQGVHAKIILERLGHSDIKTTMNIYGQHAMKQADKLATEKLESVLKRSAKKSI
ncbi:tyrosine-type recombinase/integrase [Parageobacillus thermoglucosidasius]|uniref:Tyrosine-type recombinase/integrase n=1 Tax=Parageobacillus thermoglucosidasius TaxID=1426 RepID=A0AB38R1H7_PARTM|nr:tyrosine-type recombinase/integrase [Parageobacillus thermoglucosidasius]UOE77161.1 tyrosine-type recombinase/integrase [Parageobacillus thermoglucosidasius]